jgi:GT2 family glycosyltransferase
MQVDISIIIVSWNDRDHLEECLGSLSNCTKSRKVEIITVDNASTDGSPEMVETRFPNVRLIKNTQNLGFAKGNNLGIKVSQGTYLCLINSDINVRDGCMDALADYMDEHPEIGMIGPKILNADMSHQSSCREFPDLWNNFCPAIGLPAIFPRSRFFSGEHMFYFKGERVMDADVLVGCFWMARRQAVREFGLLDEGFFMYGEDMDWCNRCRAAGWRVVFFPGAQAIHYRGGSSAKQDPILVELMLQRSILRYWSKHHGKIGQFAIRTILILHRLVRWGGALVTHVMRFSRRGKSKIRMQLNWTCLQDLFAGINPESTRGIVNGRTAHSRTDG